MANNQSPQRTNRTPEDPNKNSANSVAGTQRPQRTNRTPDDPNANKPNNVAGTQRPQRTNRTPDDPNAKNKPAAAGTMKPAANVRTNVDAVGDAGKTTSAPTSGGTLKPSVAVPVPGRAPRVAPTTNAQKLSAAPTTGTLKPNATPSTGTLKPNSVSSTGTLKPSTSSSTGTLKPAGANKSTTSDTKPTSTPNPLPKTNTTSAKPSKNKVKGGVPLLPSTLKTITLNNITYNVDGIISNSTSEAEIFRISKGGKKYVLKLYYSDIKIDLKVQSTLKSISGTGFLVDIIDCGTWESEQGETRLYEIQPFYSGGELKPGMMRGDVDRLKATAVSMMLSLKTCHDHNILHKDIKPGNFFYVDESCEALVLADYGISSIFQRDARGRMIPLISTVQWRTEIYAAPEIYTVVDGEIEYPDEKSDYFSLGMTLLTLWIGEEPFGQYGKSRLVRLKKGELGELPFSDDMPEEIVHLIKGLTVVNPDHRWGFDEFERWAKNEYVEVYGENAHQNKKEFEVLYNGSKNQVAHSLQELAGFMVQDMALAEKYLYSGKISSWMADFNYPEMQIQIDDFVNKIYPKNRQAGVYATIYLLDASQPFHAPTGKLLSTQEEIAQDMAAHAPDYVKTLSEPDSPIYVYFRACGLDLSKTYVPIAKRQSLAALWQLIFFLNPDVGFPLYDPTKDSYSTHTTIESLIKRFSELPTDVYTQPKYVKGNNFYASLLYDDAFLMWLAHRDKTLAGKVRSKLASEKNTKYQLYYYIFYLLDPKMPYQIESSITTKSLSAEQVALYINQELMYYHVHGRRNGTQSEYADRLKIVDMLADCRDNRLYYYLKSKEVYKQKLDYIYSCFDFNAKDNQKKAGPYGKMIATFKAIKALAGKAYYYFPATPKGKSVCTLKELKSIPLKEQKEELQRGVLKEWLAVQYQEDPHATLTKDKYIDLLMDYTIHLYEIDPDNREYDRYCDACGPLVQNAKQIKRSIASVWIWRVLWALFVVAPVILLAILFYVNGISVALPIKLEEWKIATRLLGIYIPLRLLFISTTVRGYFARPFGERIGQVLEYRGWLSALVYTLIIVSSYTLFHLFGTAYGRWFMPVVALLLIAWRAKRVIFCNLIHAGRYSNLIHPDYESVVTEPLFYAWKDSKKQSFESETVERQEEYIDDLRYTRRQTIFTSLRSLLVVLLLGAIWFFYSPNSFAGRFIEHGLGTEVHATHKVTNVTSTLNVRAEEGKDSKVIGALRNGEEVEVVSVNEKTGRARIKFGDGFGYVSTEYIKEIAPQAVAPEETTPKEDAPKATKEKASKPTSNTNTSKKETAAQQTSSSNASAKATAPLKPGKCRLKDGISQVEVISEEQKVIGYIKSGDTFTLVNEYKKGYSLIIYRGRNAYIKTNTIINVK